MSSSSDQVDRSFTVAAGHTTAAAVGKRYEHEFAASDNPDKSAARTSDGRVSSGQYAGLAETGGGAAAKAVQIDFHHPLEDWLGRPIFRRLLGWLSREGKDGLTRLERIFSSYANESAGVWDRVRYAPFHWFIDRMRGGAAPETIRERLVEQRAALRGLVIAARSVAEFGLTTPQRFSAPLFAVWNFTNRCNLKCGHCYQDSEHAALAGELSLEEKLDLVEQLGRMRLAMIAFSGGEPTIHPDLLPVLERTKRFGMHVSIATNGTAVTAELASRLAGAGARYVEISLDSVDAARHDAFRGVAGMWDRSVAGARVVASTPGLRLGIAMCVHQGNFGEVERMIAFARELGASCFAHFNFIPVGRGLRMAEGDLSPSQREELLVLLNRTMQEGGIGVISTAPQLGRVCLAGAISESARVTCSHCGSGSGAKARVVAKYLGGCGAGRTYVCLEPDGNVTPCVYLPHRVMGNVRQGPLEKIYRGGVFWDVLNDRSRRLHHCEVCAFRAYCGGCRARADAYFGMLHAGDPGCLFNEKHWEEIVHT
jgi:radical SAM protein with 4Fe4S-binding SPASM domain